MVLTTPGEPARRDRPLSWRRILIQSGLALLVVFAAVAGGGVVAAQRGAKTESINDALQVTDLLAGAVVVQHLDDSLLSTDRATADAAVARLDPVMRSSVLRGPVVRVKLWAADGRVVYADDPRLIGHTFPLDDERRAALLSKASRGDVTDLRRPENVFERREGKLLEVYRPVWTPAGRPLLFETYHRYDAVTARSEQLWRDFAGITVASLILLLVLQTPFILALVGRLRRSQRQRELLLDQAVSASDLERRRIAATLHDGAVQDLSGSALVVAGTADRARALGERALAERLDLAAATVRASISGLRSLLVDIYPPSLRQAGLAAALHDLVTTLRSRGVDARLVAPSGLELRPEVEALLFRVARECLRNAGRHAGARSVTVSVDVTSGRVRLEVVDDGIGFDPAAVLARPPEGHFGLRLLADLARDARATLAVASAPGRGTRWRLEVARA
jgi:signal transduction histidine kinase